MQPLSFSLRCSLWLVFGVPLYLDLFFGWPWVNHGDVDRKLMEERLRFLTCELSVKVRFISTPVFTVLIYLPRFRLTSAHSGV